jgi:hypothetical protein
MISGPFGANGHEPNRRTWDCDRCAVPFPCDPAREALASSLDFVQLAMHGWTMLEAAVFDLGEACPPTGELFDRFVAWTRTEGSVCVTNEAAPVWRGRGFTVRVVRPETRVPPGDCAWRHDR